MRGPAMKCKLEATKMPKMTNAPDKSVDNGISSKLGTAAIKIAESRLGRKRDAKSAYAGAPYRKVGIMPKSMAKSPIVTARPTFNQKPPTAPDEYPHTPKARPPMKQPRGNAVIEPIQAYVRWRLKFLMALTTKIRDRRAG